MYNRYIRRDDGTYTDARHDPAHGECIIGGHEEHRHREKCVEHDARVHDVLAAVPVGKVS